MKEQDLRDKLSYELRNYSYPVGKCVQIAKDYAEQEAIEFAEWIVRNCNHSRLRQLDYFELYKEFKNRENER